MIPQSQVNLRKVACPFEVIKQVVNPREMILVLYSDSIEVVVINAHSKGPIFLIYKQNGVPQGEILVLMETLSSKSLI